ncbi:helix-turn-helix domain-containing protein [Streptomyces sp. NPDC014983]|uniref:helix-turn-helix domain-containing protein n=1 Tax=Streptomyces sp. NPDC014983 TaxID=3364933 RepID=UPI00370072B3
MRIEAAELFAQRVKPPEVARWLRVSRKPAYQWHQMWKDAGTAALASRGPSGQRSRLSPYCLGKPAEYLDQGPAAHGWVEEVWTAGRAGDDHRRRRPPRSAGSPPGFRVLYRAMTSASRSRPPAGFPGRQDCPVRR